MSEVQNLQAQITLVMQPEDYQEQVEKEIRQLRQKAQIPGFRAGNVPKSLIRKMYGKNVLADVINKELGTALQNISTSRNFKFSANLCPMKNRTKKWIWSLTPPSPSSLTSRLRPSWTPR